MARFYSYTIFTFLFITHQQLCTSEPITLVAIGVISGIMGIVDFIWDKVEKVNEIDGEEAESFSSFRIKGQINRMTEEITKAVSDANAAQTLKDRLNEATDSVDQIDEWYAEMVDYNKTFHSQYENETIIEEAVKRLHNGPDGPRFYLRKIHKLFFYDNHENILQIVYNLKKGYSSSCLSGANLQSVQQIYSKFYMWTTISAAKAYLTILMAVEILRKINPGVHADTLENAKRRIIGKHEEAVDDFKDYMERVSLEVWRCDPEKQIEGVTYTPLKNLFQKYIIKESNMGIHENNCRKSCSQYDNPAKTIVCNAEDGDGFPRTLRGYPNEPNAELCGNQRRCNGELWDCKSFNVEYRWIRKNDHLSICNSDKNGNRRYDYVEKTYGRDGTVLDHWGRKDNCKRITTHATTSSFSSEVCDICMCTCAERASDSDEFISLEPVFSDADRNRVVTGARIVKTHNTIRIEIEEGTLGPVATIVNNEASWLTRTYKKPTEADVSARRAHRIIWKGGRQINLNELRLLKNHALVGLGFERSPHFGIYLAIYSRPFDFATGKVNRGSNEKTAPTLPNPSKFDLDNHDVPTSATRKNVPIEGTNKFLEITTTGLKEDIGQTVIPYFDIQPLTTSIHIPMSGAGLYLKKDENYGGFLALKLFTYNVEPHIYDGHLFDDDDDDED